MTVEELIECLMLCEQQKRVFIWEGGEGWIPIYFGMVNETEHDDGYEGKVQIG